jgi:hypothetical protein
MPKSLPEAPAKALAPADPIDEAAAGAHRAELEQRIKQEIEENPAPGRG